MDSKLIILLILILFGMIAGYMVANGMIDLVSIFSRVTKSQAEESLGGVKLQVDSPVAGVYYQTTSDRLDLVRIKDTSESSTEYDMVGLVKVSGKNLDDKMLTISVASPNWYLDVDKDGDKALDGNLVKTAQLKVITDANGEYLLVPASVTDLDTYVGESGDTTVVQLVRKTGTGIEPFDLPEFVELIFAVGETAKAEVTIVAEP